MKKRKITSLYCRNYFDIYTKKDYSRFDSIIANNKINLIYSIELIDEFIAVTKRPKFRPYFEPADVESILQKIRTRGILIKVLSEVNACRDAKDNFLLSLAVDANASHLITGDKDLLVLEKFGSTQILTLSDYLLLKAY